MKYIQYLVIALMSVSLVACGGEEKSDKAGGAGGSSAASEPTSPEDLAKAAQEKMSEAQAFGKEIQDKIKNGGYEPTEADKAKMQALMDAAKALGQKAEAAAKAAAASAPSVSPNLGAEGAAGLNAAKEALKNNGAALKAIGGAKMGKMVDGATEAMGAIGKDGAINMKKYKAGVGKQLDALEAMGGDRKAAAEARKALKAMPANMPAVKMPANMPAMPKMPSGY